jgi:hypothetical protein
MLPSWLEITVLLNRREGALFVRIATTEDAPTPLFRIFAQVSGTDKFVDWVKFAATDKDLENAIPVVPPNGAKIELLKLLAKSDPQMAEFTSSLNIR